MKQNHSSILQRFLPCSYEDVKGNLKALVHLVDDKMARGIEDIP
jgi:hypothetical protein